MSCWWSKTYANIIGIHTFFKLGSRSSRSTKVVGKGTNWLQQVRLKQRRSSNPTCDHLPHSAINYNLSHFLGLKIS
ncbi:hypothetical protein KC19_4G017800 [Ceratodon purpureus]|uniref:Uncharacterized protein n=1 Tax=Ceratodon purpureus TaxID=3225 RepID=A0A8T0I490_CERPU|nr:hypothetical protein KC19_4G017800 [Ceratodon purpureus]